MNTTAKIKLALLALLLWGLPASVRAVSVLGGGTGGGSGTPAGSTGNVQYNSGGVFASDSGILYDPATGLTLGKLVVTGDMTLSNSQTVHTSTAAANQTLFTPDGLNWYNSPTYTTYWREKEFATPTNVSTNTVFFVTTSTLPYYGKPLFTIAGSSNSTYVEYDTFVPTYLQTTTDPVANFKILIGTGTDLGSHKIIIDMADLAGSGAWTTPNYINPITVTFTADAAGLSGDVESATGWTLTGWGASMTAGHALKIRVRNDPSGTSTVNYYLLNMTIDIPLTRP